MSASQTAMCCTKSTHLLANLRGSRDFRLQLAIELIGDYCSKKRPGCRTSTPAKTLPLARFPLHHPENKRGRCQVCKSKTREEILFGTARLASNGSATVANQRLTVFIYTTRSRTYPPIPICFQLCKLD